MTMENGSAWSILSRIDVSKHTEEKNGFTYLSWAWAWATLKENFPFASFHKHTTEAGLPYFIDNNGYAYVTVTVSLGVAGDQATEVFPVLDYKNKAIQNPDSFEVNTALQRCLAKAISYLGLGAYIYAGEDLPPAPPVPKEAKVKKGDKTETISGPEMIAEAFKTFIPACATTEQLEEFWKNNGEAIAVMKTHAPNLYAEVVAAFKKRKEAING